MPALGFDVGGTNMRVAVVAEDGRVLQALRQPLADRSPSAVVAAAGEAVKKLLGGELGGIRGSGVAVAGQVRGSSGVVAVAPNLGWRELPLSTLLAGRLPGKLRIVNDLKAAAWGEHRAGAGRGVDQLVLLFVGSGVGSGYVLDGILHEGSTGVSGEIGHIKVAENGPPCGCGHRGCLEAYAGGHNMARRVREAIAQGKKSRVSELAGGSLDNLTVDLIEKAAMEGDPVAGPIFDEAAKYLGQALANLITLLNPQKVLLGGGVLAGAKELRRRMLVSVDALTLEVSRAAVSIEDAALGDDAGVIGAALLAAQ